MRSLRLPAALAALALAVTACSGGGGGNGEGSGEYPRNETLYTTGTAWGPPVNWNPLMPGQFAVGILWQDEQSSRLCDAVLWRNESRFWARASTPKESAATMAATMTANNTAAFFISRGTLRSCTPAGP